MTYWAVPLPGTLTFILVGQFMVLGSEGEGEKCWSPMVFAPELCGW